MTDIALADTDPAPRPPGKSRRRLLFVALALLIAGGGFASSYMGLWSPLALAGLSGLSGGTATQADTARTTFIDVPPINVTLPDARPRMLHLVVKLEVDEASAKETLRLLPRVMDTFNTFLTGIAPDAFERRGILEIIREELRTRVQIALESQVPVGVLIMEFGLK